MYTNVLWRGLKCMIHSHLEELQSMKQCNPDKLIGELVNNQLKIQSNDELYYDRKVDQVWINHYYKNVSKNTTNAHRIFQEFHTLIAKSHRYRHPYFLSKNQYLYTWVDLQPD